MSKLFADSNRASLREIIEDNANWGTTPVNGKTRARRFTSSSVTVNKDTAVSAEIRDDRMVSSIIETAASTGGDINWEFAAGTIDLDLQRALMGAWTRPMDWDVWRGKIVAVAANNQITVNGKDLTGYLTVGRRIRLSGFVNAANNDYFQISAVAFAAGKTTITITTTTLVAEAGNAFSTVADANDVIVLKGNGIRGGNAATTFDSNGANAFAAAVAAKQLVAGQRIFVEAANAYESGTLTCAAVADNDTVTISDGVAVYTFEAQADTDVVSLDDAFFAVGVDDTATAANLAAAINKLRIAGQLNVSAKSALGVVTVHNLNKDGGAITAPAATITVVDFTGGDATLGGFYTIISVTDDVLTVDRAVPVFAAGPLITIKGSMLRNPGKSADITAQSASLETGFQDVSQFFLSNGMRTGGLSIEVSSGAIVKGTTKLMGSATIRFNATKLGNVANYTPLESAATEVVSATANVGALLVDGVELATAIQSIKLDVDGSLREQRAVGAKFPKGIAAGRLNLTGTVAAYFADAVMYDRFINHETVSLAFPIIDQDKNTYYFTVPSFKVTSDPIAPGGIDQDVMDNMEVKAFRDVATECMMQIDRFSSTAPSAAF
jgi:hypothetical protein